MKNYDRIFAARLYRACCLAGSYYRGPGDCRNTDWNGTAEDGDFAEERRNCLRRSEISGRAANGGGRYGYKPLRYK